MKGKKIHILNCFIVIGITTLFSVATNNYHHTPIENTVYNMNRIDAKANNDNINVNLAFPMRVENVVHHYENDWGNIPTSNSITIIGDDHHKKTSSDNIVFTINFSIFDKNSPLSKYYIGDWYNIFDATLTPQQGGTISENSLFRWDCGKAKNNKGTNDNYYFGPFWRYYEKNNESFQAIRKVNYKGKPYVEGNSNIVSHTFDIKGNNPDIDANFVGCEIGQACKICQIEDWIYIWAKDATYSVNPKNAKCSITYPIFLLSHDGGGTQWSTAYNTLSWQPAYYFASVKLHYSLFDLNLWKQYFVNTVCEDIVLENVNDPVIFDKFNDKTDNELTVKNIIEQRIQKWYKNGSNILNKIGYIANYDSKGKFLNKTDAIQSISLDIPDGIRGKSGKITTNLRIKLQDGCSFYWNQDNTNEVSQTPSNTITFPINISAIINPALDLDIDKLIHIEPFVSPINVYDKKFIDKHLNIKLSDNNLHLTSLHNFKVNINEPTRTGELTLIDREKLAAISKVGTNIDLTLSFSIGNNIINKQIMFDNVYNNGTIFQTISFDASDFKDTPIASCQPITLGLTVQQDKIFLFNNDVISFTSTNPDSFNENVDLKITHAHVSVPVEQEVVKAKWEMLEQTKYITDGNNHFKFAGTYQTSSPFIFIMNNLMQEVHGNVPGAKPMLVSRYKPFLRINEWWDPNNTTVPENKENDYPIFPNPSNSSEQSQFISNLGTFIMDNKQPNSVFKFSIIVKEYENKPSSKPDANKYTKIRWWLNVKVDLSSEEAHFVMNGYQDNKIIQEENKTKYFNKESPEYRGEYVEENSGMYKPKIVWVHALPPETFPYDPLDEAGNVIVDGSDDENTVHNFDVGYIAEINATGFAANDYNSITTFGGYETIFNQDVFHPNGVTPYQEGYIYNLDDQISTLHSPLSQSGLQTVNKTNFNQVVLRVNESNNYLYQFIKINSREEILASQGDILKLYSGYQGLGVNQPLFEDFFTTYHGKNFIKYLQGKSEKLKDEESIRALSYPDLMQYWNIYVNSPEWYSQPNATQIGKYNIAKLNFDQLFLKENNLSLLKEKVIAAIATELKDKLVKAGWIANNSQLIYQRDFMIELNDELLMKKIEQLQKEYSLPLSQAQPIDFYVAIKKEAFKDKILQLEGSNTISIFNNQNIDSIIDLALHNAGMIKMNSNVGEFASLNKYAKIDLIETIILNHIQHFIQDLFASSDLEEMQTYEPQLNVDYSIKAYSYIEDINNKKMYHYVTLRQGIENCLMYHSEKMNFDNNLFIEINAIKKTPYYLKNHCTLQVNNASFNENLNIIQAFNLSSIKAGVLKINTTKDEFQPLEPQTLTELVESIITTEVQKEIDFYAGKWMAINNLAIEKTDYQIKYVKALNDGTIEYYDTPQEAIDTTLLKGVATGHHFDNSLTLEIIANKNDTNYKTSGHYFKEVNNSDINDAIDNVINQDINGVLPNDSITNGNLNELPQLNDEKGKEDKPNLVWIITPITIFVVTLALTIIIYYIRKNRKIR